MARVIPEIGFTGGTRAALNLEACCQLDAVTRRVPRSLDPSEQDVGRDQRRSRHHRKDDDRPHEFHGSPPFQSVWWDQPSEASGDPLIAHP